MSRSKFCRNINKNIDKILMNILQHHKNKHIHEKTIFKLLNKPSPFLDK